MPKETGRLKVIGDVSIPMNRIIVNPNDGYDLGLLTSAHAIKIFGNAASPDGTTRDGYLLDGQLLQENSCGLGTAIIGMKLVKLIGAPSVIRFSLEGNQLRLIPMDR